MIYSGHSEQTGTSANLGVLAQFAEGMILDSKEIPTLKWFNRSKDTFTSLHVRRISDVPGIKRLFSLALYPQPAGRNRAQALICTLEREKIHSAKRETPFPT